MGRFVGKIAVGGRLLDDAVGGMIHEGRPGEPASSGRLALPFAAEQLARSASDLPIHLITEDGPTLRVVLGRSEAVGELYLACDFAGEVDDVEVASPSTFSILAYPDLRTPADSPAVADDDAEDRHAVVLAFPPARREPRPACSDRG